MIKLGSGETRNHAQRHPVPASALYAPARHVASLSECCFYHTMDIPGYGPVVGQWDLRKGVEDYLSGVDFRGKRVLEIGTANGFLCFEMEQRGADVVAYDLSENHAWDIVPFVRSDTQDILEQRRADIRRINNGYWLCHRAHASKARVVYGTVYAVPEAIGPVDIATFGCILLHVRDPLLALANALRLTRDTVIITEMAPPDVPLPPVLGTGRRNQLVRAVARLLRVPLVATPSLTFVPDFRRCLPLETWWRLSPEVLRDFLGLLGFEQTRVSYHHQLHQGVPTPLFTIVGRRTAGRVIGASAA